MLALASTRIVAAEVRFLFVLLDEMPIGAGIGASRGVQIIARRIFAIVGELHATSREEGCDAGRRSSLRPRAGTQAKLGDPGENLRL